MVTARWASALFFGVSLVVCIVMMVADISARNMIVGCVAANSVGGLILSIGR